MGFEEFPSLILRIRDHIFHGIDSFFLLQEDREICEARVKERRRTLLCVEREGALMASKEMERLEKEDGHEREVGF